MSVIIFTARTQDLVDAELYTHPSVEVAADTISKWIYPSRGGVQASYRQKCLDTVTGLWTEWETLLYPDQDGKQYPGDGFDPATYRVAGVTHGRVQE